VEESIYRRGLEDTPMLSPTPIARPKRATRLLARFSEIVGNGNRKKDKGKGR
jgi:hypothetical protein